MRKTAIAFVAASAVVAGGLAPTAAQEYPERPVQLVVPFSAGGGTDVLARLLSERLSEELGQRVVIDNRDGAGGTIGTDFASDADADGYTLLILNALPHTANEHLRENLGYDPVDDFVPVGSIGTSPYVLVVNSEFPVDDYSSFIEKVQAEPGQHNYASAGIGSATHLAMELFAYHADLDVVHIPYSGGGAALNDVAAGRVPMALDNVLAVTGPAESGDLLPLAVSGESRAPSFPEVPTFAEHGLVDLELAGNWGLVAPAGTPEEIVTVLNDALAATINDEELSSQLQAQGIAPSASTPAEFGETLSAESEKWARLIEDAGIEL